jgi:hypothetical protein
MRIFTLAPLLALAGTASAGESFTFKFSVGPIESGRARMSVGAPTAHGERQLVSVHGQAETSPWLKLLAPLDDDYRLVMDPKTHLPVQVVTVERGLRERRIAAQFDGRRAELEVTAEKGGGRSRRLLPSPVRDPLSQLFALRAAPLAEGDVVVHDILDGAALWRMRIVVHRGELLRLDMDRPPGQPDALPPSRTAIRLEGELTRIDDSGRLLGSGGAAARHFTAWLSDDAQRVLLRAVTDSDLGKCTIELTSYIPGSS